MHWIQKHILILLSSKDNARYTELIPEGIDGNLFSYHLKQLTGNKTVEKINDTYTLTSKGKRDVATLSLQSGNEIKLPRVFAMLYIENEKGQICLYDWQRQPYLGHKSLPFGRVVYGTSVRVTALETLKFKTGLEGEIKFHGTVDVIVQCNKTTATHYITHIFRAIPVNSGLEADGSTGTPFWGTIDSYGGSELVYGTKEIVELIKTKKSPFFKEILVQK